MESRSGARGLLLMIPAVVAAAVLVALADPAVAKGPESLTVAGPGIERPVELIVTDNVGLLGPLMEQTGSGTQPAMFQSRWKGQREGWGPASR